MTSTLFVMRKAQVEHSRFRFRPSDPKVSATSGSTSTQLQHKYAHQPQLATPTGDPRLQIPPYDQLRPEKALTSPPKPAIKRIAASASKCQEAVPRPHNRTIQPISFPPRPISSAVVADCSLGSRPCCGFSLILASHWTGAATELAVCRQDMVPTIGTHVLGIVGISAPSVVLSVLSIHLVWRSGFTWGLARIRLFSVVRSRLPGRAGRWRCIAVWLLGVCWGPKGVNGKV
jgi:hypothetical protein